MYDYHEAVDIYVNFQKVYDKLPHRRVLHKISELCIGGKVLCWLCKWLAQSASNLVGIGQVMFEWGPVTYEAP